MSQRHPPWVAVQPDFEGGTRLPSNTCEPGAGDAPLHPTTSATVATAVATGNALLPDGMSATVVVVTGASKPAHFRESVGQGHRFRPLGKRYRESASPRSTPALATTEAPEDEAPKPGHLPMVARD